jgi:endonuclease VIII
VKLMGRSVADRARTLAPAAGRRTTGSLHPAEGLWVYGRNGRPCRRCRTPIAARKAGADARLTYWCPRCQPARVPLNPGARA